VEKPMLRRFLLLTLFVLSLVGFAVASAADTPESVEQAKKEVLKVCEDENRAVERNDADALGLTVSDDLEYTNQMGEVLNKAQWLARIRSGKQKSVTIKLEVDHVHVFGNTVVVTGTSRSTVIFNGKVSDAPRRSTRVFVKQDGVWKLVVQHVTLIAK
jgi:ketosteroid isomerase-like protein